jgi:hypothetical protein
MSEPGAQNLTEDSIPNKKFKKGPIIIGGIIAVSVVANAFFIFYFLKTQDGEDLQNRQQPVQEMSSIQEEISKTDILSETHKIVKEVRSDDVTWFDIETPPRGVGSSNSIANHEIWLANHISGEEYLVETFLVEGCGGFEWEVTMGGGIDVLHTYSPCEAFMTKTRIIYDVEGVILFMMKHSSNADSFTFSHNSPLEFEVSLVIDGVCDNSSYTGDFYSADGPILSKVSLRGIKIKADTWKEEEETYLLSEPQMVSCGMGYDEIINPSIGAPSFDGGKIEFLLPNGQTAVITDPPYGSEEYVEKNINFLVEFK